MNRMNKSDLLFEICLLALSVLVLVILLAGCTTTPPAELPHYPCKKQEDGKVVYYACSDMEWVEQQIMEGKK